MKNKLIDLNNHLFSQIERLSEEGLDEDEIKKEVQRSNSMANLAKQVIANAKLALDAEKFKHGGLPINANLPAMIEDQNT